LTAAREIAPAKLNLALHVRGKLPDGRHAIETIFAFCTDGDRLSAEPVDDVTLRIIGPMAEQLGNPQDNMVWKAAMALKAAAGVQAGAAITLDKRLPVASGIGGGSADAAAALRLLTSLWRIDPAHAEAIAPTLGSDVPACRVSLPARGEGAGDRLTPIDLPQLAGKPVVLVNPRVGVSTAEAFAGWNGIDQGPLEDWQFGFNGLEEAARAIAPQVETVIAWLSAQPGVEFVRMSGSGATCFALFETERARDDAAELVPREWWHLATFLR